MKKFLIGWWPSICVFLAIVWLTLSPRPIGEVHVELFTGADKIVHALMMGGLAGALVFDLHRSSRSKKINYRFWLVVIALTVILFSAIDEWLQGFMHFGRTSEIQDFIADIVGVLISVGIAACILMRKPSQNE